MRRCGYVLLACVAFWALLILGVNQAFGAGRPNPPLTYYVDSVNGLDTNAGTTPETAIKSVTAVNALTLWPGDSVLFKRGCIWYGERLYVQASGKPDSSITYGAYGTGERPIHNIAYPIAGWTREGQKPCVWKYAKANKDSAFGLWIGSVLGTRVMTEAALDANFKWIVWPDSIKVMMADTSAVVEIANKALFYAGGKSYLWIRNIEFRRGGILADVGGVYFSGASNNIVIDGCRIREVTTGTMMAINLTTTVRNCLIENTYSQVSGITWSGAGNKLYNNTIIVRRYGLYSGTDSTTTIKNNVVVSPYYMLLLNKYIGDNNLFLDTDGSWFAYKGATYSTLSAWQDSTGQEANSIVADPGFIDAANGDYHVSDTSPAIGLGAYIPSVTEDYDGNPRRWWAGYTSGAFEREFPMEYQYYQRRKE